MAHRVGKLSWDQLRWVTRFATSETDEVWATRAAEMRPDALRLESLRQRRLNREQAERDRAMRRLSMVWDEEGRNLDLQATLPAEQGARVEAALNAAAQQVTVEDDVDDRKGARLADAFVGLVTASGGRSQTPTLVIHADAEVLARTNDGDRHLAETSTGVQLSQEAIRRVACDAKVLTALHRGGRPVGLVSKGRAVTGQQMEILVFRDRGCTFPGCGSTWFLHAHHIRHWAGRRQDDDRQPDDPVRESSPEVSRGRLDDPRPAARRAGVRQHDRTRAEQGRARACPRRIAVARSTRASARRSRPPGPCPPLVPSRPGLR